MVRLLDPVTDERLQQQTEDMVRGIYDKLMAVCAVCQTEEAFQNNIPLKVRVRYTNKPQGERRLEMLMAELQRRGALTKDSKVAARGFTAFNDMVVFLLSDASCFN